MNNNKIVEGKFPRSKKKTCTFNKTYFTTKYLRQQCELTVYQIS